MVAFFVQHKSFVRFLSLILIFALCISGLTVITPAADALVITATATAIIITFFALCGITFASADLAKKSANEFIKNEVQTDTGFWADIKAASDRVDNGGDDPGDPLQPGQLAINAMTGSAVAKLINKIKSWFGNTANDGNVSVSNSSAVMFQGVKIYTNIQSTKLTTSDDKVTNASVYSLCPYSLNDIVNLRSLVTGDLKRYSVGIVDEIVDGSEYSTGYMYCNGVVIRNNYQNLILSIKNKLPKTTLDVRYGFYYDTASQAIHMYEIGYCLDKSNGQYFYSKTQSTAQRLRNSSNFSTEVYYSDFIGLSDPAIDKVPYKNKTVYSISSIYNALSSQIKSGNSVVIDISDTITEIEDITTENLTINQEQLLIQTDILTALEELVASQPDDPYEGVPKPSPMPTIGNIWDFVSDFLEDALIWMKLWVSGFNELPQSLQDTLWAILVVVIVVGILGVIL